MDDLERLQEEARASHEKFKKLLAAQRLYIQALVASTRKDTRKAIRKINRPLVHACYYGLGFKEAANVRELCEN